MGLTQSTLDINFTAGESVSFGNVSISPGFGHRTRTASASLANGTGAAQANHTVDVVGNATTGGVTIDLTAIAGGLDGLTRDFSNGGTGRIKHFLLENLDVVNTITVTLPVSNGWTGFSGSATVFSFAIEPGCALAFTAQTTGKAVTSTNKLFTLTSNAGTPQYQLSMTGVAT